MMKKSVMAAGVAALLGVSAAHAVVHFETHGEFTAPVATRGEAAATGMSNVSPGGIGHVLFTPYYSTVNGNVTLISLVNTDNQYGKAVKVRFRGAANSDDVLDFTVLLSPGDVWTGSIQPSLTDNARLLSPDTSCVLPRQVTEDNPVDFRTFRLDQKLSAEAQALHTREGYIEFLNMADISPWQGRKGAAAADTVPNSKLTIYSSVKHKEDNKAPCDATVAAYLMNETSLTAAQAKAVGLLPPTGGLFGNWSIFNNQSITSYSGGHYASATVDGSGRTIFSPQVAGAATLTGESADPLLSADAMWGQATAFNGATRTVGAATGKAQIEPLWLDLPDLSTPYTSADISGGAFSSKLRAFSLSKALEATAVMNEFVATGASASVPFHTDWVFSQPTRRYQVAMAYSEPGSGERNMPVNAKSAPGYQPNYFHGSVNNTDDEITGNMVIATRKIGTVVMGDFLCTRSDLAGTNREEASATTVGDFSPAPVVGATRFCGETATLSFNSDKSRVLHAEIANQRVSINVGSGGSSIVEAGWATVTPKAATSTKTSGVTVPTAPSPQRVTGLPVIGYSATSFSNGATNGNFGSAIEHRYRR